MRHTADNNLMLTDDELNGSATQSMSGPHAGGALSTIMVAGDIGTRQEFQAIDNTAVRGDEVVVSEQPGAGVSDGYGYLLSTPNHLLMEVLCMLPCEPCSVPVRLIADDLGLATNQKLMTAFEQLWKKHSIRIRIVKVKLTTGRGPASNCVQVVKGENWKRAQRLCTYYWDERYGTDPSAEIPLPRVA